MAAAFHFEATSDPQMAEAIDLAPQQLPADQREAVLLHKLHGLSFPEVAAALGTTCRLVPLVLLIVLQVLGTYAAIAPGTRLLRRMLGVLAVSAVIAIVADRGLGASSATPEIACSASHLGVNLIPLGLVLLALRRFSWSLDRSLLAGVAAAATGAIAGELSCARGWGHALVHHVGAGLLIAVACVVISRLRKPQTFAP